MQRKSSRIFILPEHSFLPHVLGDTTESWNQSRKSRRPNFFNSQDFERVDSLNASFDTGKIMSVVIPQHSPDR